MPNRYYLGEGSRETVADAIDRIRGLPADHRDRHGQPARYGDDGCWIQITGAAKVTDSGAGIDRWQYAWTEQRRTSTSISNQVDARSGTTTVNFARNVAESPTTDGANVTQVPVGTTVRAWLDFDTQDNPQPAWTFAWEGLPDPGSQYMVLQVMNSSKKVDWDFVRAHS